MGLFSKRAKDFQRCLRNIHSFSDGQAKVMEWDMDRLRTIQVELAPSDGPYKGGHFVFEIRMPDDYPNCPPLVTCRTHIYHPNIDSTCYEENVCLSLFEDWDQNFGLEDITQGLLFLLYNPNLDDPLSPYFGGETTDVDAFEENVKNSLLGEEVEDVQYERNWHLEEESDKPIENGAEDDDVFLENDVTLILEEVDAMVLNRTCDSDDEDNGGDGEEEEDEEEEVTQDTETSASNTADPQVPDEDNPTASNDMTTDLVQTVQTPNQGNTSTDTGLLTDQPVAGQINTTPDQNTTLVTQGIISRQNSKIDRDTFESGDILDTEKAFDQQVVLPNREQRFDIFSRAFTNVIEGIPLPGPWDITSTAFILCAVSFVVWRTRRQ